MNYEFSGSATTDIGKMTITLLKKYRKGFFLIVLFSRVINAGIERYGDNYGNIDTLDTEIATLMQEPAQLFLDSMGVIGPDNVDTLQEQTFGFYEKIRETIKPYIPTIAFMGLLSRFASTFMHMTVIHQVLQSYKNSKETTKNISETSMWKKNIMLSLKQFFPFLLTNILVGVLLVISLGLFIIPGFILIIYLSFVAHIMLDKNLYFFGAIKESYRLVRGKRWKTFGVGLTTGLAVLLMIMFITSVGVFILSHISSSTANSALSGILTSAFVVISQVFMTAFYLRRRHDYEAQNPKTTIEIDS